MATQGGAGGNGHTESAGRRRGRLFFGSWFSFFLFFTGRLGPRDQLRLDAAVAEQKSLRLLQVLARYGHFHLCSGLAAGRHDDPQARRRHGRRLLRLGARGHGMEAGQQCHDEPARRRAREPMPGTAISHEYPLEYMRSAVGRWRVKLAGWAY